MEDEEHESKLVPTPAITFDQFRAKIDSALDELEEREHVDSSGEVDFAVWLETLEASITDS